MSTNLWANYFEDIPGDLTNLNAYTALEAAYYLLNNPSLDPQWQSHVAGLIAVSYTHLSRNCLVRYPWGRDAHRYRRNVCVNEAFIAHVIHRVNEGVSSQDQNLCGDALRHAFETVSYTHL